MARDERDFWALITADATVLSLVGTDAESQIKVYASPAPEGVSLPLVTFFLVSGDPTNKLAGAPNSDRLLIQVDIFSRSKLEAKAIHLAIRNAVETSAYQIGHRDQYESEIMAHRISADFSYIGEL